jgi:hypothetical protein
MKNLFNKLILNHSSMVNILAIYFLLLRLLYLKLQPSVGLDPSWAWYMSKAQMDGLAFGFDVIYTWGPLAFLETGVCISEFQLIAYIVFSCIKVGLYIHCFNKISTIISDDFFYSKFYIYILVIYCGSIYMCGDIGYMALILTYSAVLIIEKSQQNSQLFIFGFFLTLGFFIKITLLIQLSIVLVLFLLNSRNLKIHTVIFLIFGIIMAFVFGMFNTKINWYLFVTTSLEVISGYSMVMALDNSFGHQNIEFILLGLFFLMIIVTSDLNKSLFTWLNKLLFFMLCFIIYKSAFTRFDDVHSKYFLSLIPIFFWQLKSIGIKTNPALRSGLLLFSFFVFSNHSRGVDAIAVLNDMRWHIVKSYKNKIGQEVLSNKYGRCLLIANKLTPAYYDSDFVVPPSPQNFCTYTDVLDRVNSDFFIKHKFKFVSVEAEIMKRGIDNRHPFLFNRWFFSRINDFQLKDSIKLGSENFLIFENIRNSKVLPLDKSNSTFESNVVAGLKYSIGDLLHINTRNNGFDFPVEQLQFEIISYEKSVKQKIVDKIKRPIGVTVSFQNDSYTIPDGYFKKKVNFFLGGLNVGKIDDSVSFNGRFTNMKVGFSLN